MRSRRLTCYSSVTAPLQPRYRPATAPLQGRHKLAPLANRFACCNPQATTRTLQARAEEAEEAEEADETISTGEVDGVIDGEIEGGQKLAHAATATKQLGAWAEMSRCAGS